ncbi:ATP-binding protein [Streptomyces pathocidini]|uniref:ATP-binding protein n=1 Tax=Streptomyces pathocidini TaxID=1650571 RepID=A0ABW7UJF3_9ACTN|nr:ATP-binding protein [Streptomyces pathocidini]
MDVVRPAAAQQPLTWSWRLTVKLEELAHYRRLAKAALRAWGESQRTTETVLHGVTELLSNVKRHAGDSSCSLRITKCGTSIFVAVHDNSPALPEVTTPDWTGESGRGLWLLREIADAFGYTPTPDGKRVWFRVAPEEGDEL